MDSEAIARVARNEDVHWWYSARREIIKTIVERFINPARNLSILEAGCGTGGNIPVLQKFGSVDAFEMDESSRAAANSKSQNEIAYGSLPNEIPNGWNNFDLITSFDVIEHVEDDVAALAALKERLKTGGKIFVTVPAVPWLWSTHDEVNHHFRRYTSHALRQAANNAGLKVKKISYFNTLLFPLAAAKRFADRASGKKYGDFEIPARWLNALFYQIFRLERFWIGLIPMPIGVSLFAILEVRDE